jgi:hypothetical protein
MHLPINVKSPNNISKWQMGFNSAFKGLMPSIEGEFEISKCPSRAAPYQSGSQRNKSSVSEYGAHGVTIFPLNF